MNRVTLPTFRPTVPYPTVSGLLLAARRDVVTLRDAFPVDSGLAWVVVGRGRTARRVLVEVNGKTVVAVPGVYGTGPTVEELN